MIRNNKPLTRAELAQKLEMSLPTVDRWVRLGIIPAITHKLGRGKGRRIYFDWRKVAKSLGIPS